jgi:hypothetical protein
MVQNQPGPSAPASIAEFVAPEDDTYHAKQGRLQMDDSHLMNISEAQLLLQGEEEGSCKLRRACGPSFWHGCLCSSMVPACDDCRQRSAPS